MIGEFESEAERVAAIKAESDPVRKLQQYIRFVQERYGRKDDTLGPIDASQIDNHDFDVWSDYLFLVKRCKSLTDDDMANWTGLMMRFLSGEISQEGISLFNQWIKNLLTSFIALIERRDKIENFCSAVSDLANKQDKKYFLSEVFGAGA